MAEDAGPEPSRDASRRLSRKARLALRLVLVAAVALILWGVFKDVPWAAVGEALAGVSALQLLALLGLVVVRALVAALPLNALMREISPTQAARNDLAGNLVANFAPPPADIGVRYAMFRSWRVDPTDALAALSLSALMFYAARFGAPIIGFTLILLTRRFDDQYLVMAAVAGVVSLVIVAGIVLIARAERGAAWLGRSAARVAGRVRDTEPREWEQAMLAFRARVNDRLRRGWPGAVLAVAALFVVETVLIIVCMRFVGVPAEAVVGAEIAGAFLVTYPLNMLPLGGLIILDGLILEILVLQGGAAFEGAITAGLLLWRVATLITPFILGLLVLVHWQRREGRGVRWRSGHGQSAPAPS